MGLQSASDWQGKWIGSILAGGPVTSSPAPFLRTDFKIDQEIVQARLFITALGLYEAHLNGQIVHAEIFAPGWTDYHRRVQYQVYDVSRFLSVGDNTFGAVLGDGWYCGYVGWGSRQLYGDRPKLLAQLLITLADGSTQMILTDEHWRAAYGPILESDFQNGESYDARREFSGWDRPGFDDRRWLPAEVFEQPGLLLDAKRGPGVKRMQELWPVGEPREVKEGPVSKWIFDLGQNMVGRVRIRVRGAAGTTITLRHAEVLNPDGSLYVTNLRRALATDHYTLKGQGEEIYEPKFTFHGFRYVELSGYPGPVDRKMLCGVVIHSDLEETGFFECSDPLINQLQHNIQWGQRGNFLEVPTDCPQRNERMGWTGDAQVFTRTAAYNMDIAGFFTKWLRDLEDAQSPEGYYPTVAPNPGISGVDGGPAWGDAGVICPWTIYQWFGDTALLQEHYDGMRRYVEFLHRTSKGGLRNYPGYTGYPGHGDWLALDGGVDLTGSTPKDLIGTAFYAYSANLLSQIASVLGKDEDAQRFKGMFEEARKAFQNRFVTGEGLITSGTQTAYVLALFFDLLPEHLHAAAVDALVQDIQRRGMHLSTGFVGTPYLNWVLSENGRADVAYQLLNQQTWPSWLYSVTQGATTIWERWDGWTQEKGFADPGMNSFNHYAYGAIGAWLYAVVGGIDLDPAQPGYRHIRFHPRPGGGLTHATARYQSIHGMIESAWKRMEDRFDWRIIVPPNTSASVYVPVKPGAAAVEDSGIKPQRREVSAAVNEEFVVYEVPAGTYHFTVSENASPKSITE
jgi:alpha-L-rhamnosidase